MQNSIQHPSIKVKSIYLLTYLFTLCSRVLEKLTGFQLVKKFPPFYRTRRFIMAVTSARHLSLSRAISIKSTPPHPTSWRTILISSSYLGLGLPSCLSTSGFPTKTLYKPLPMPHPSHSSQFYHLNNIGWGVQIIRWYSFLHSPVTSSLLGPNILNILFSNTFSLCSSLNVSNQVSHPYKTTGKIYISWSLNFLIANWKSKDSAPNDSKHSLTSICF